MVCQSEGYKSLKADYLNDLKRNYSIRDKTNQFKWIIGRATSHAYHRGVTLDVILNEWEAKRTINWRSFYYEHNQMFQKLNQSNCIKPSGITAKKKVTKASRWYTPKASRERVFNEIMRLQRINSKRYKTKMRWAEWRKKVLKRERLKQSL